MCFLTIKRERKRGVETICKLIKKQSSTFFFDKFAMYGDIIYKEKFNFLPINYFVCKLCLFFFKAQILFPHTKKTEGADRDSNRESIFHLR